MMTTTLFGRIDRDLGTLRCGSAGIRKAMCADPDLLLRQLMHHCIRVAWREHARSGTPVRGLLRHASASAYCRLYEVVPLSNDDREYFEIDMGSFASDAQRENEETACVGFFIEEEVSMLARSAADTSVGLIHPQSMFSDPLLLSRTLLGRKYNTNADIAYLALLKLRDLWNDYLIRAGTDPLVRRTIQIVASVTGKDPQFSPPVALEFELQRMR